MVAATLSRWTMSYFAAALAFLLAAEALMAFGYGFPATSLAAPETLIVVHLVAIGWLSLLMLGALFQFVPVLVAWPIYSNKLPLPTLIILVTGLAALLLGFLQLSGTIRVQLAFFPAAGGLLSIGFALALWNLGRTLWRSRPLPLPARFVSVGLLFAAATTVLGTVFACVLGGLVTSAPLLDLVARGIPLHAVAGLGGWLTFTAIGVSYRLLAMFMLSPERETVPGRIAFYTGTAALVAVVFGGTIAILANIETTIILIVSGFSGLCAFSLYGGDIWHLYRARRRRFLELNARMAMVALSNLGLVVILSTVVGFVGSSEASVAAIVFLASFGWLTGLGLAKLYKIVAFLTWLESYGPRIGKMPTPRVQDLVVEPRATIWFWLYFIGVWVGSATLLFGSRTGFGAAATLMMVATAAITIELVRIRTLSDVKHDLRRVESVPHPRLFSSLSEQAQ